MPLTPANLRKYDVVLISTDHSCYDYAMIAKNAKLVVDTRNAVKGAGKKGQNNLFRA